MSSASEEDADNLEAFLEEMRYKHSTTPTENRPRCPDCGSISIDRRGEKYCTPETLTAADEDGAYWRCKQCQSVFDDPDGGGEQP